MYSESIPGTSSNDQIYAKAGNDILDAFYYSGLSGNGEIDSLRGDAGADTFVIGDAYGKGYLGNSYAVIEDFNWQDDIMYPQLIAQFAILHPIFSLLNSIQFP